ncbi:unnamed protein product [Rotaria sp. Silwood2]|nr:unnamed protein product [Rotaria sp. Silwood2]CAF2951858.1 unnamed protein product [Rotaria sp. Silwood2]CAF4527496.1 unnamed protein product [Rotaria sp. Silwood2]
MSSSSSTSSSNESAALSLSSSSTIRQRSNTNIVTGEELVESVLSYVKELKVAKNFKLKIERQLRNINFQENEADNTTTAEPDDTTTVESDNDTAVERDQTCDSNCRSRTINYAWTSVTGGVILFVLTYWLTRWFIKLWKSTSNSTSNSFLP